MYRNEGRLKILEWYDIIIFFEFFVSVLINYPNFAEIFSFWLKNIKKSMERKLLVTALTHFRSIDSAALQSLHKLSETLAQQNYSLQFCN